MLKRLNTENRNYVSSGPGDDPSCADGACPVVYELTETPSIRRAATQDFWLFDARTLVYLIYDGEGRFLRLEKEVDQTCLAHAHHLKDDLLAHAVPLEGVVRSLRGLK